MASKSGASWKQGGKRFRQRKENEVDVASFELGRKVFGERQKGEAQIRRALVEFPKAGEQKGNPGIVDARDANGSVERSGLKAIGLREIDQRLPHGAQFRIERKHPGGREEPVL